jgi:hypothetical protein
MKAATGLRIGDGFLRQATCDTMVAGPQKHGGLKASCLKQFAKPQTSHWPALNPWWLECLPMKVLVGIAGGWIGFSLADKALFDGRLAQSLPRMARAVAAGFGFYFWAAKRPPKPSAACPGEDHERRPISILREANFIALRFHFREKPC